MNLLTSLKLVKALTEVHFFSVGIDAETRVTVVLYDLEAHNILQNYCWLIFSLVKTVLGANERA
jgi:hypothetical protein